MLLIYISTKPHHLGQFLSPACEKRLINHSNCGLNVFIYNTNFVNTLSLIEYARLCVVSCFFLEIWRVMFSAAGVSPNVHKRATPQSFWLSDKRVSIDYFFFFCMPIYAILLLNMVLSRSPWFCPRTFKGGRRFCQL